MKNGNLVFDSDGTTILYEEKEITDKIPFEVILNKLGEPDTVITVIVTAEDNVTGNEYQVTIKRPYGIIKGSIKYDEIEENDNDCLNKTTNLSIYNNGQINWDELSDFYCEEYDDPMRFEDLDLVEKDVFTTSLEDGTYEIKVIPRTCDLQIEKLGFLNYIITGIKVEEGSIIDLDTQTLIAGDVTRDGIIGLEDIQKVVENMDITEDSPDFLVECDLVQYGVIGLESLQYTVDNSDEMFIIEEF